VEAVEKVIADSRGSSKAPNIVPIYATIPADTLTPCLAYMRLSAKCGSDYSFLFESAATTETIARYSFVGAGKQGLRELQESVGNEYQGREKYSRLGPVMVRQ
jgi:anthranilate/para-aminobenzoate synthase component I